MRQLWVLFFVVAIGFGLSAQKSEYIFHKVAKGETLYGLSKQYEVSMEQILELNNDLVDGVKPEDLLLIPNTLEAKTNSGVGPNYTYHVVARGQTVYGICKQYGVDKQEFAVLNPSASEGLSEGQVLKIKLPDNSSLLVNNQAVAQTGNVKHTVAKGETWYALSKKYGVSVEDLAKANTHLPSGLKVGSIINIPPREKRSNTDYDKFHVHKVQEQETVYSLSKKYHITIDSLYLLNPNARDGIRIGQSILFPKDRAQFVRGAEKPKEELASDRTVETVKDEADTTSSHILYKIKAGDTFYSLQKKYHTSQAEILELNPEFKGGLIVGKHIIVPLRKPAEDQKWLDKIFNPAEAPKTEIPDSIKVYRKLALNTPGEIGSAELAQVAIDSSKIKTLTVGVMLPFFAPQDSLSQEKNIQSRSKMALDFYNGFALAADSLARQGLPLNIRVIDTRNNRYSLREKSKELQFYNPDLVIGPLYQKNVEWVADNFAYAGVPVVSPLSNTVNVNNRSNLINCKPSPNAVAGSMAHLINEEYAEARVIFAHSGTTEELQKVQTIKARLLPRENSGFVDNVVFNEEMLKRNELADNFVEGKEHLVVILSEDPVFLSDLIAKLRLLKEYNVSVVGPNKLMKIKTLELDYLSELNIKMFEPNFFDYQNPSNQKINKQYRKAYGTEPSSFALQGFDVGYYFLYQLGVSNGELLSVLDNGSTEMTSTGFKFEKEEGGGYSNQFLFLTSVKDFSLVRIKF